MCFYIHRILAAVVSSHVPVCLKDVKARCSRETGLLYGLQRRRSAARGPHGTLPCHVVAVLVLGIAGWRIILLFS